MRVALVYDTVPSNFPSDGPPDIFMEIEGVEVVEELRAGLERKGHSVTLVDVNDDIVRSLSALVHSVDVAFNYSVGFGSRSREVLVPSLCQLLGIPHTGADAMGLALMSDKHATKLIAREEGIPTPDWVVARSGVTLEKEHAPSHHVIAKPMFEGSSIGVVGPIDTIEDARWPHLIASLVREYEQPILVEDFIAGYEITMPVLCSDERSLLPPLALILDGSLAMGNDVFSGAAKARVDVDTWSPELPVSGAVARQICEMSMRLFRALGCRDYARFDFRVSEEGDPYLLEANAVPSLTARSGAFAVAGQQISWSLDDIVEFVCLRALERS